MIDLVSIKVRLIRVFFILKREAYFTTLLMYVDDVILAGNDAATIEGPQGLFT